MEGIDFRVGCPTVGMAGYWQVEDLVRPLICPQSIIDSWNNWLTRCLLFVQWADKLTTHVAQTVSFQHVSAKVNRHAA